MLQTVNVFKNPQSFQAKNKNSISVTYIQEQVIVSVILWEWLMLAELSTNGGLCS